MTLRSKYGGTPSKRTGRGSNLPRFDLPRFESSRFDRLRGELTPPRFDVPKFENGFDPQEPNHSPAIRSTGAGRTNFGLNWFSLLEREVNVTGVSLTAEIRLSSAETSPSNDETVPTANPRPFINKQDLRLPEFDRPRFESGDYARLKLEADLPKFDRPRFDEPDEI